MVVDRRGLLVAGLGAAILPALPARASTGRPLVKIGVLTDMSGPYREIAGEGSVACARLAAGEFAANAGPGFDIAVVSADHHNDVARGASLAAHWCDQEGIDLILDVPNSDVALAVAAVAREKNRPFIACGPGTPRLTGAACSPNTIHWSYDTFMLARSTGGAFTKRGGSNWFFITADYGFGRELQADTSRFVIAAGGRIDDFAAYPFPGTTDFTSLVRAAQASGASVLALANAGTDATACLRAAHDLNLDDQMRIAALLMQLPDVHLLGLDIAGGSLLTESFYWDLNDRTRAFTRRLMEREKPPSYPDMIQAGCYAGTLHFLKAVAAMGVANARSDGAAVVAHMKAAPTDDDAFGAGAIRRDGRGMFPAYLFQVKTAQESAGQWDYYRLLSTTPAEQAYRSLSEGGCGMAKG